MKKLTLTLYIDPATAIRCNKTICGDVQMTPTDEQLAELTPKQRETLALHVAPTGTYNQIIKRRLTDNAPPIGEVTLDNLRMLLDLRAQQIEEDRIEEERKTRKWIEEADASLEEAMANLKCAEVPLKFDREGKLADYGEYVTVRVTQYKDDRRAEYDSTKASPEVRERFKAFKREVEAKNQAEREAALPAIRAAFEKVDQKVQQRKEQWQEVFNRLPEVFRRRCEAGFASDEERNEKMREIIRQDAELGEYPPVFKRAYPISELTDGQFLQLEKLQQALAKTLPEGYSVEAYASYRDASEEEIEEDVADADGEIQVARFALVSWVYGGLTVRAHMPFGEE